MLVRTAVNRLAFCSAAHRAWARSAVAADVLQKMGYTNVRSLAGGITAYQAAGLPLEQGSR